MIRTSLDSLIGRTPLLELTRIEEALGLKARIAAKLEGFNPAGSAKDRVALAILNGLEERGELAPGGTVIEPTSGNTGIGLAALCAARGYRLVIVMPDTMSAERRQLMKAYGAELELTPGAAGMAGAIARADELAARIPGAVVAGQFTNPDNPRAHETGTGPEIWEDAEGGMDIFVAGAGTGGTVTGVGRYLKARKPAVQVVAVEPAESAVLSEGPDAAGPHTIQGIGAGFVPEILDLSVVDEVVAVSGDDAYKAGRLLARTEGILAGVSSGAALAAAIGLARREDNAGKTIVVLFPDTGERYLSCPGYLNE